MCPISPATFDFFFHLFVALYKGTFPQRTRLKSFEFEMRASFTESTE